MLSYQYPLRAPHGAIVEFLFELCRRMGSSAAPPPVQMSRRHRMMFVVDERRAHRARTRGVPDNDFVPPAAAAVSQPTQFGPLCFAVATHGGSPLPADKRESARSRLIRHRVTAERSYLALERQYLARVRAIGLDDGDARGQVRARKRRIRLLRELRHPARQ
jgi:hypothetical protein